MEKTAKITLDNIKASDFMIKKEEYLKALDVVEQYHRQLDLQIVKHDNVIGEDLDISKLQIGDYLRSRKKASYSAHTTIGKKYEILDRRTAPFPYRHNKEVIRLQIRNDKGTVKWIKSNNHYGYWSCGTV